MSNLTDIDALALAGGYERDTYETAFVKGIVVYTKDKLAYDVRYSKDGRILDGVARLATTVVDEIFPATPDKLARVKTWFGK